MLALLPIFVAVAVISEADREVDQCRGCRSSVEVGAVEEGGKAGVSSLLQRRSDIDRLPLPEDTAPRSTKTLALAAPGLGTQNLQPKPGSYADAIDKECVLGSSCTGGGVPSARGICVSRASSDNECWDVCNSVHEPTDYQSGNVLLDIKVHESVENIRGGKFASVECQAKGPVQEDEAGETVASSAPLDEVGYKKVASLKRNSAMEAYVRRVVSNTGCRVADESKLQGVVPFYSGETAVQTYAALEAEIYRACTGAGTWLSSLYPGLSGQESQSSDPLMGAPSKLGSTAPITEQGFQEVIRLGDDLQMLQYSRRVVSMLHGWVVDESGLHGLEPFFDGEKSVQTLGALILEIETAMQRPDSWVMKAPEALRRVGEGSNATGDELIPATPLDEAQVKKQLASIAARKAKGAAKAFQECPEGDLDELHMLNTTAWSVPLDEQGYEAMTQLKSDCAMFQFASRIIGELHCHLLDESGLKGLVPFYSGNQDKQDIHELRTELHGACSEENKWLVPDVRYWANHGKGVFPKTLQKLDTVADTEGGSRSEGVPETRADTEDDTTEGDAAFTERIRKLAAEGNAEVNDVARSPKAPVEQSLSSVRSRLQGMPDASWRIEDTPGVRQEPSHSSGKRPIALIGEGKVTKNKAWRGSWACRALKLFCPPGRKSSSHKRRQPAV